MSRWQIRGKKILSMMKMDDTRRDEKRRDQMRQDELRRKYEM